MAMAGLALYEKRSPGVKHYEMSGSFIPNGSSAIATQYGVGFVATRTGTGAYRITITRPFAWLVSWNFGIMIDDVDAHTFVVTGVTLPTSSANGYVSFKHLASADVSGTDIAEADITASGTARRISFNFTLAESDCPGAGV